MSDIKDWSNAAASNSSAPPDGFPENQAPNTLNNSAREVMAAVRRQHEDAEWINLGYTCTNASTTTFTISGVDATSHFVAGRRIRIVDATTLYGEVVSSSFSTNTTVTVSLDSGSLSASMNGQTVSLGVIASNKFGSGLVIAGKSALSNNGNLYHGRVDSAGTTVSGDSGFTVSKTGTGIYLIIHNLGATTYTMVLVRNGVTDGASTVSSYLANSVEVRTFNTAGSLADAGFSFMLIPD